MSVRLAAAATLAASLALAAPAQADILITQEPCGQCLMFEHSTPINNFHRTLGINAPAKGKALVSVTGTLYCHNLSTLIRPIGIHSQLVRGNEAVSATFPQAGLTMNLGYLLPKQAATFNLAGTRLFAIDAPGTNHFRLRLRRIEQHAQTTCWAYNVALTIDYRQD